MRIHTRCWAIVVRTSLRGRVVLERFEVLHSMVDYRSDYRYGEFIQVHLYALKSLERNWIKMIKELHCRIFFLYYTVGSYDVWMYHHVYDDNNNNCSFIIDGSNEILVEFVDDGVKYRCPPNRVLKKECDGLFLVKWKNGKNYLAKIISGSNHFRFSERRSACRFTRRISVWITWITLHLFLYTVSLTDSHPPHSLPFSLLLSCNQKFLCNMVVM
jgi:hypothetical protein